MWEHEPRRLVRECNVVFHQVLLSDAWQDVCEFTLEQMPLIDREVAHWFTSTSPNSHFRNRLLVARAGANGSRHSLLNREYSERDARGHSVKHTITSPSELLCLLDEKFGLQLPPVTHLQCDGLDWP